MASIGRQCLVKSYFCTISVLIHFSLFFWKCSFYQNKKRQWTRSMTGGPWTRSMKVVHGPGPKWESMFCPHPHEIIFLGKKQNLPFFFQFCSWAMKILPQSAESFKQSVYKAGLLFAHANEYVTTILPLFSNLKNNSPQSVLSLDFTLPCC